MSSSNATVRRRTLLGAGAVATAALAGCTDVGARPVLGRHEESESSFDLEEGTLEVDLEQGSVEVRPGAEDVRVEVSIQGSLLSSLEWVDVTVEREDETVVVRGTSDEAPRFRSLPTVEVTVDVPTGVEVANAVTRNGNVTVEDVTVESGAELRARNGNVRGGNFDADVTLETRNGNVEAADVGGFVAARTRNGNVSLERCDGLDGAASVNGNVAGEIPALRDDTDVETRNGNVHLSIAPDVDADLHAEVDNGTVDVEALEISTSVATDTELVGTLGDGGHELRVHTRNGNVSLSRLER